jgi:hypothetical protein
MAAKNIPLGLELYTGGRWVALGTPYENPGSVDSDCSDSLRVLIATYFPAIRAANSPNQDWEDGPVPEWRGPTDDDALLAKAMASISASAAFGTKASFADLWTANVDKLHGAYPAEGRDYDASSADAALAQHLAFWTGNDCVRIERLMRESALVRDKWDAHRDYLQRTILGVWGDKTASTGISKLWNPRCRHRSLCHLEPPTSLSPMTFMPTCRLTPTSIAARASTSLWTP